MPPRPPAPPSTYEKIVADRADIAAQLEAARNRQFNQTDPSKHSNYTAKDDWDLRDKIRGLSASFDSLGKSLKELDKIESVRAKRAAHEERGRESLYGQLSQSFGGTIGSSIMAGRSMAQGFSAQGGMAPTAMGKAGGLLALANAGADVAETAFATMNRRTQMAGKQAGAEMRGDAVAAFEASTERTAAVLDKIPIAGKAVAEAFRSTAVAMRAYQDQVDGFSDRMEKVGQFDATVALALGEAKMSKVMAMMEEGSKHGAAYAAGVREAARYEIEKEQMFAQQRAGFGNNMYLKNEVMAQKQAADLGVVRKATLEGVQSDKLNAAQAKLNAAMLNRGFMDMIRGTAATKEVLEAIRELEAVANEELKKIREKEQEANTFLSPEVIFGDIARKFAVRQDRPPDRRGLPPLLQPPK